MKKSLLLSLVFFAGSVPLSLAYAQNVNNPNDSSYPASSNINSVPNEPDHTFGSDSSVHKLPANVPNKNVNVIYNQPATTDKPSIDSSTSIEPSSGEGNTTHLPVSPVPPPPVDTQKP